MILELKRKLMSSYLLKLYYARDRSALLIIWIYRWRIVSTIKLTSLSTYTYLGGVTG